MRERYRAAALGIAAIAALGGAANAPAQQAWPEKPVRIVVPFPPGGSADVLARLIGQRLASAFGQSFVVENRAGAGGNVGTEVVVRSPPDGYTLGLSTSGPLVNNRFLYKSMSFDGTKDLVPIILVAEIPILFSANPAVPAKDLKAFVDLGRAKAGQLNVGSPGNGTIGHLTLELLKSTAKVDLVHVPFKGDTPAMTEVMAGNIQALAAPVTPFIGAVRSGKLKGLAVTTRTRFAGLPDVPTAVEQGIDIEASVWFALVGPAGLPRAIVDKANQEADRYLTSEEGRAKLADLGAQVVAGPPERLGQLMANEATKWQRVIEASGAKLD
jgi:tripartite-type tricarboxylate transporter receptor subunit TctC